MLEEKEIRELMKSSLKNCFSFFNENHKINVHINNHENICIGYRTTAETIKELRETTHFDIQLIENICYILNIELDRDKRGSGLGWNLYGAIHCFAKDFGCEKIRQTPSGWTPEGKTRRDYLLEKGYVPFGKLEVELKL